MIGNKLEQSIIKVFQDDLSSTFSINQISKNLKKSYPIINKKSNFLISEGILKKITIGRSYQCFLNSDNEKAKILMSINELNKRDSLSSKDSSVEHILDELYQLSKKFEIQTVVLHKKNILLILKDTSKKHEILEMTALTSDYILSFYDSESFKHKFFSDMDLQKYSIVLLNVDYYISMISDVIKDLISKKLFDNGSIKNKLTSTKPVKLEVVKK